MTSSSHGFHRCISLLSSAIFMSGATSISVNATPLRSCMEILRAIACRTLKTKRREDPRKKAARTKRVSTYIHIACRRSMRLYTHVCASTETQVMDPALRSVKNVPFPHRLFLSSLSRRIAADEYKGLNNWNRGLGYVIV